MSRRAEADISRAPLLEPGWRRGRVLALEPGYERAALVLDGDCKYADGPLPDRQFHYLGTQRSRWR